MYENIINKLTKANYVVELHGKDEAKKLSKICREHCINTDFLIRSFGCKEIKNQDKIYAVYSYVAPHTSFGYDIVLFYHESYFTVPDDCKIIRFDNDQDNHKNELISWIKI